MIQLFHGDCLEEMKKLDDNSIDLVLTDPPYGKVTACKWDSIIPLTPMWAELKRIIKFNSSILLMAKQPFTTALINSNMEMFKYCWYWKKTKAVGFQHSKNKPMSIIEDVCVFSQASLGHKSQLGKKRMNYNPQGVVQGKEKIVSDKWHGKMMGARPNQAGKKYISQTGFPNDLLEFKQPIGKQSLHPTQKPVALMNHLIAIYTKRGDTVLDFTMGSGTTGIAAKIMYRNFIGIELDKEYFEVAKRRIGGIIKKLP